MNHSQRIRLQKFETTSHPVPVRFGPRSGLLRRRSARARCALSLAAPVCLFPRGSSRAVREFSAMNSSLPPARRLSLRLAGFAWGRVLLHVAVLLRSRRHVCWHLRCIRREFSRR